MAANNKLHFYMLDKRADAQGVLHYKVGVRSTAGAGPQTRGVVAGSGDARARPKASPPARSRSRTRARQPRRPRTLHPQDASAYLDSDTPPLGPSTSAAGWEAHLKNVFAVAKFGETVQVPVYIAKAAGAAASGSVTLNATSESDPSKSMSLDLRAHRRRHRGRQRAGDPGSDAGRAGQLGGFTPGAQKDYFATTAAKVTSTASDAMLSVADPSSSHTGKLVNGTFALPETLQANAARHVGGTTPRSAAPPHRPNC